MTTPPPRLPHPARTAACGLGLVLAEPARAQGERLYPREPFAVIPDWLSERVDGIPWESALGLAILAAALAAMVHRKLAKKRHKLRIAVLGLGRGRAFMLVDVLCHAVWRGRRIDPARLARACQIARDVTGMDYTKAHIREAASRADRLITPLSFRWMRPALSCDDRRRIIESAVAVMIESGPLTAGDRSLLRTVSRAIAVDPDELGELRRVVPT